MNDTNIRQIDFSELATYARHQSYHSNLRPYQQQNKEAIYKAWGEGRIGVMLQMPTGTGKTHLFSSIIKDLQDYTFDHANRTREGLARILVLVHRKELVEQIEETLSKRYGHSCGIVTGGHVYATGRNVIIASVQTMSRKARLEQWVEDTDFDFIIIDEAHHSTAESYQRIRNAWPNARLLGVTATPYRLNHQPFTDTYDELILSAPVHKFIEQGYLCHYDYYSIRPNSAMQYRINHLKTDRITGDYDEREMFNLMGSDHIRAGILDTYERFAKGKKGIVYTINRQHNVMLAGLFASYGYRCAYIDSETPKEERAQKVRDFKEGRLDIIFNVNIFSEGFDCPDVEFIQLVRPTKSLAMYLQQVGRGFRTAKGKEKVLFLDNVGLFNRFGLPSANRHWRHHFEGREDWEEEKRGKDDPLEEHHYTEPDLSEGNEEILKVYTSVEGEEVQTQAEEDTTQCTGESQPQEETTTTINNEEMIIKLNNEEYDLTNAKKDEVLRVLLKIEEEKHTGVIDTAGIRAYLAQRKNAMNEKLEELMQLGFSKEEIAAAIMGQAVEHKPVDEVDRGNSIGKGLYVITREGNLIQDSEPINTFIKAVREAGMKRVYDAKIPTLGSYLVNTSTNSKYPSRSYLFDGYFIVVNHSDEQKVKLLNAINKQLGLGWTVGIHE